MTNKQRFLKIAQLLNDSAPEEEPTVPHSDFDMDTKQRIRKIIARHLREIIGEHVAYENTPLVYDLKYYIKQLER